MAVRERPPAPTRGEPVRFAQAAGTASDAPGGLASDAPASGQNKSAPLRLSQLKLDDVRVDNGTIRYSDARSGSQHEIKSLNVSMALPAITEPLTAKGDMVWNGKAGDLRGRADVGLVRAR